MIRKRKKVEGVLHKFLLAETKKEWAGGEGREEERGSGMNL